MLSCSLHQQIYFQSATQLNQLRLIYSFYYSLFYENILENYLILTKYTAVILDYTLEPSTTAVATVFNNASYCGVTSWSSGSETSIAGKTCSSSSISSVNDGFRDIVQMNSERTYIRFGNTSDLESDGYPSTVYANKYYKFYPL